MKTIGVIGGIGPQATIDFELRLHAEAQRVLPQHLNTGYPPLLVYYFREPPIAVDQHGSPLAPLRLSPRLLDVAAAVGSMSDFIVVTANTVHSFADELERAAGKPLLNMMSLAVEAVLERGWRRCGVIGMGLPTVYTDRLAERAVACETLTAPVREHLDRAIVAVMEGRADASAANAAGEAVNELVRGGVDGVILGCTELPLLLGTAADGPMFVNPGQLLARAALRWAMEP